jgi:3-isopropylmalate/(R)-2-methylmalate dehydratase small subunit
MTSSLRSRVVVLAADDVDTDQIIPARFLKGTSKTGLGAHLFADWRARPDFPLTAVDGARILLTGANFGCGSSREHAVWALAEAGFRAIIARSFADIFRENAAKNGVLAVALPHDACACIERAVLADRHVVLAIDLPAQHVCLPDARFEFAIDPFAKRCIATGLDELGYLLSFDEAITRHERRIP